MSEGNTTGFSSHPTGDSFSSGSRPGNEQSTTLRVPSINTKNDESMSASTAHDTIVNTDNLDGGGAKSDLGRHGSFKKFISGIGGSGGDSGPAPSRRSSIASAVSSRLDGRSQAASRKNLTPFSGGGTGAGGLSSSGGPRPPSSASRTHVPLLAAQGFLRPMSSRRLQAQRNQRPNSLLGGSSLRPETRERDGESSTYRQSVGSDIAVRGTPLHAAFMRDSSGIPPPSQGSNMTDYELQDRTTVATSLMGAETVQNIGDTSLNSQKPSQHIDFGTALKNVNHLPLPVQTSSKTFQSSFIVPGDNGMVKGVQLQNGSEKSQSGHSTLDMKAKRPAKNSKAVGHGKNYEYFTGNTVFCWGGRLQNTRDRPVSIASAIGFILPCTLYFIFAYVAIMTHKLSVVWLTSCSAPWIWRNISPAIPLIYAYLFLICLSSFIHASATNPGVGSQEIL